MTRWIGRMTKRTRREVEARARPSGRHHATPKKRKESTQNKSGHVVEEDVKTRGGATICGGEAEGNGGGAADREEPHPTSPDAGQQAHDHSKYAGIQKLAHNTGGATRDADD